MATYYISSGVISNGITLNNDSMYISSGGVANSTTVYNSGFLYIYSGGVANSTTVYSRGFLYIYSGGTANSTTVNSSGRVYISSGGTANSTTVNSGGSMYISSGGTANSTTVSSWSDLYISSGGVADNTTVNSGYMYISSGGIADNTTVYNYGALWIYAGGVASSTTLNSRGDLYISSGGVANSTTVNYGGRLFISSGGTATAITENGGYVVVSEEANVTFTPNTISGLVLSNTHATLHSGTVATSTTLNSGGDLYISSGGVANSTTVNYGGKLRISSGGTATAITENGGYVYVAEGATVTFTPNTISGLVVSYTSATLHSVTVANSTTVNNGGLYISSGGIANSTTVNSNGSVYISSGGVANSTTVNYSGSMRISSGGVANSTTVCSGGYMTISSGGTATAITENGGYVVVAEGANVTFTPNTISGLVLSYADTYATLHSGTVANSTTLSHGYLAIFSGGVANSTIVNYGYLSISSGGVANSTTVNGGKLYISSGGTATAITENGGYVVVAEGANVTFTPNTISGLVLSYASATLHSGTVATSTTLNSHGYLTISSGGVADNTTVNNGGLYISSGGTATAITENGGYVVVDEGANVTFTPNTISGLVLSNTLATLHSGTVANSTKLSYVHLTIFSGGVANSTIVNAGNLDIYSGGVANSTTVNGWGGMSISSGGVANSTTVNDGYLDISSGGVANSTTVNGRGGMSISSGGVANSTTVNSGWMYISSGGTATDIKAASGAILHITVAPNTYIQGSYAGSAFEMKDAKISGYTVNYDGKLYIFSGGVANSTTVNSGGWVYISSGGVANSTTVNVGGSMRISSGGKHTGSLDIASGGVVSASFGAIVDFDLRDRSLEDAPLINNLAWIKGTPNYTITVAADQNSGTYQLASGADSFSGSITITDGVDNYGQVTVNGASLNANYCTYTLTQTNGNLQLTVQSIQQPDLAVAAFSLSKDAITVGDSVTLNFTVANNGTATALSSYAYIYDGDVKLGQFVVGSLAAGAAYNGSFTVAASKLPLGEHNFRIELDATNRLAESNESNNSATATVTVNPKQPDLEFTQFAVSSNSVTAGEAVTLNFTVANNGTATALSSYAYIYDGDVKLGQFVVGSLAAGAAYSGSYAIAGTRLALGEHNLRIELDTTDRVTESNEANNSAAATVTVNPKQPDLEFTRFAVSSSSVTAGEAVTLNFTVQNSGTANALSSYAYIYDGNVKLGQFVVGSLAVDAIYNGSYTIASGRLTTGTHNLRIELDTTNRVAESNEANNSATASVTVNPKQPDLTVTTFSADKTFISAGETVALNFTVQNNGQAGALASWAYLYDGNTLLASTVISGLSSGAEYHGQFNIPAGKLGAGNHGLMLIIDATNRVAESNENNNLAATAIMAAPAEAAAPAWEVLANGDFDGDDLAEQLLLNELTGEVAIQTADNTLTLGVIDSAGYELAGIADFNGDFCDDIVWSCQGEYTLWQIKDNAISCIKTLETIA